METNAIEFKTSSYFVVNKKIDVLNASAHFFENVLLIRLYSPGKLKIITFIESEFTSIVYLRFEPADT